MTKYFAKWLPVEGVKFDKDILKERILAYNGKYGKVESLGLDTGMPLLKFEDGTDEFDMPFKVVKLFLCTRDIQVGDTVWTGHKGMLVVQNGEIGPIEGNWMHQSAITLYHFKVIGEISKSATWVKEGDEFDEEDIKRDILVKEWDSESEEYKYIHYYPKGTENFKAGVDKIVEEYSIEIKCPCCETFK